MTDNSESVTIRCTCGSIAHTIGIEYFEWANADDQPDLYLQTIHGAYLGFWQRLWAATKYVVHPAGPLPLDATCISREDAEKMFNVINKFRNEHDRWIAFNERVTADEDRQK